MSIPTVFCKSNVYPRPRISHLNDKGFELVGLWSFQNTSKGHDCSISISPVYVLYVFFNEWQNMRDNVIFTTGGQEHEADSSSFAGIPVIVIIILILKESENSNRTQISLTLYSPKIRTLSF